jgi:hypothetical protein
MHLCPSQPCPAQGTVNTQTTILQLLLSHASNGSLLYICQVTRLQIPEQGSVLSMHNTVKRSFRHLSDLYLTGFKPMDTITHQHVCVCSGMFADKVVCGEGLQWNGSGVLQAGKWQGVVLIC